VLFDEEILLSQGAGCSHYEGGVFGRKERGCRERDLPFERSTKCEGRGKGGGESGKEANPGKRKGIGRTPTLPGLPVGNHSIPQNTLERMR